MQITKVNYAFAIYLALIESIALFVLDFTWKYPMKEISGLLVGFIPAIIVLWIYRLISKALPIKLNGKEITSFPILIPSLFNAVFIELAFLIQSQIPSPGIPIVFLTTIFSILISSGVFISMYNGAKLKIEIELDHKLFKIRKIDLMLAAYAGLFELFILPFMYLFYYFRIPSIVNGLIAGLIGSLISVLILNRILQRKSLQID